jgi:UDP-2,3-diacylglucosamine pyrophosphatase LpxH
VLSDVHRGARNAADDFRQSERAYSAALAYYYRLGHTLILLGDGEELWEERPAAVIESYARTFELEARYHQEGRYMRVWGNHDDLWQYREPRQRFLAPLYGLPELRVCEGVLVDLVDGDALLGQAFLVHGHQGDAKSSEWSWLARLVIRYLWRPFQRLTHITVNTPATRWDLRHRLNQAMYAWAEKQSKLLLIAGHTHEPVFKSKSHESQIKARLKRLEDEAGDSPTLDQRAAQAGVAAELEWTRAEEREARLRGNGIAFTKPCYFNTGCCSYSDGDITGIEIADGEIRLVRWPDEEGDPKPHVLARDALRAVLAAT